MTNIIDTLSDYKATCEKSGTSMNNYISRLLQKLAREKSTDLTLFLAGNNRLMAATRLSDTDASIISKTLFKNTCISTLDLRYNNISNSGAQALASLLQETKHLAVLNLMMNDITEDGAVAIAKALEDNKTLISLTMTGNKIGRTGGMMLAQALQINNTLQDLQLADTDQKDESLIAFATVLNYNTSIRSLNINRPLLTSVMEEVAVHYANMLKVNSTLKSLQMEKYDMRDFGAERLSDKLIENDCLDYLDLSCNRITRDGTLQLCRVLRENIKLTFLDLGFNRLEDDGAMYLADALANYNTTLKTLVIVFNNIRGRGLCAIADSMKFNQTLERVYIWGNVLEESAAIAWHNLLLTSRLYPEDTDVRPYAVDGVTILAEINNRPRANYYWGPFYGDNVPKEHEGYADYIKQQTQNIL